MENTGVVGGGGGYEKREEPKEKRTRMVGGEADEKGIKTMEEKKKSEKFLSMFLPLFGYQLAFFFPLSPLHQFSG